MLEAAAPAMGKAAANVRRARETMSSRQTRRTRQDPPCFDGSETVSRFRPFLRRRDKTARPQRVAMRARNPCLLIRRLLRGRYDGFIRNSSQVSRESYLKMRHGVKLRVKSWEGEREPRDFSRRMNFFSHRTAVFVLSAFFAVFRLSSPD
jgi:hypothetical protein